ncbi:hypothetical protein [Exiguobacterium sp. UBA5002]|uniref:hypothetical protein n=1 Tax=Exiguobacterium sp. UBA5002 TaxID=1946497 RepID=UPI0025C6ADDD|nr:hypothetical protein [Exiguobacterium sp. UBA5002]
MMNYDDSNSVIVPLVTGKTKDFISRSLKEDNVIKSLNESQLQEFLNGLSTYPDSYFIKNSIAVTMTSKQHTKITEFINNAFNLLNTTDNFEVESDIIQITKHYKKRLIERSDKYDQIFTEDILDIKKDVCQFGNVSNIFRWNHKGITYVLSRTDSSSPNEKIIISIKVDEDGNLINILIKAVTYINE